MAEDYATLDDFVDDEKFAGGYEFDDEKYAGGFESGSWMPSRFAIYLAIVVVVLIVYIFWDQRYFNNTKIGRVVESNPTTRGAVDYAIEKVAKFFGLEQTGNFVGAYARDDDMKDCRVFNEHGDVIFNRCAYA